MNKTTTWAVAVLLALATAPGCSKKESKKEPSKGATTTTGGGAAGAGAAGTSATGTAAGGAIPDVPLVADCPKSLSGSESVNRVIKKECGPVAVADLYVVDGGSLTMEAGSSLVFQPGGRIEVGYSKASKLIVNGTVEAPVVFTSGGDKVAGVWGGVVLYANAQRSALTGLVMEFAGLEDKAALRVEAADVAIKGCTFRGAKGVAIEVSETGSLAEVSGTTFDAIGKAALDVPPAVAGQLGAGNKYSAGIVIQIQGRQLDKAVTWNQAAPYLIKDTFNVAAASGGKASLEIGAGIELRFAPGARLEIGYSNPGTVRIAGTKEAPVRLVGTEAKGGAWSGLTVYDTGELTLDNAIVENGGPDESDGVVRVDGKATINNCTFRKNVYGPVVRGKLLAFDGNTFEGNEKVALAVVAEQVGALGPANVYDKDARIRVLDGQVNTTATWKAQGAVLELSETLNLQDGVTVTVEAGSRILAADSIEITVGYSGSSNLKLLGTKEKPIEISGVRDEPNGWNGIHFYSKALSSEIKNVILRNVGGEGAVQIDGEAVVAIDGLTAEKCEKAALTWACGAKVTAAAVKGAAGTPKGEIKPDCN
jgi:hypothetical protein